MLFILSTLLNGGPIDAATENDTAYGLTLVSEATPVTELDPTVAGFQRGQVLPCSNAGRRDRTQSLGDRLTLQNLLVGYLVMVMLLQASGIVFPCLFRFPHTDTLSQTPLFGSSWEFSSGKSSEEL